MFSPDYQLNIDESSAVFTIGALEQLGTNFEPFLQYLLEKQFRICINIETIYELYNQSSLFDYLAVRYLERRGYLQGYLVRLKQLEEEWCMDDGDYSHCREEIDGSRSAGDGGFNG